MRFPSLRSLGRQAVATARRFPLPLLSAAAACGCAIWSIDATRTEEMPMRGLQTALLGLPLLLAVTLVHARTAGDPRARRWRVLVLAAALAALGAYFLAWPSFTWTGGWTRFLHLAVAFYLLVAFLPFVGPAQLASFWAFNRTLLLRVLLAALFAAVLYGGATVALLGLDRLFELGLDAKPYMRLALLAALLFHPWHFLAGVPRLGALGDGATDVPTGLRVFAQFILVPLVAIYLLILNGYAVRLLALQHWPVGFLGLLVGRARVFHSRGRRAMGRCETGAACLSAGSRRGESEEAMSRSEGRPVAEVLPEVIARAGRGSPPRRGAAPLVERGVFASVQ